MTDEELKKLESETKEQDEFVFMREEIKSRPINRKKLMRNTIVAAISALVFGLVACVTFALLAPFVMDRLSDKDKEEEEEKVNPIVISFPEDTEEEEMTPEEMLITSVEPDPEPTETPTLDEEEIKALISDVKFNLDDYQNMYKTLSDVAVSAQRYLVRVTPVKDSTDIFNNAYVRESELSGIITETNETNLFITTKYSQVKGSNDILVTFCNGVSARATIATFDTVTDLCVLSVLENDINEVTRETIKIATLGSSTSYSIVGMPIIAVGSPLGSFKSVNYGIITSNTNKLNLTDSVYKQLLTNIYGSSSATGVLINLKGEILGIIDTTHSSSDTRNLICAYGISELKKPLERMMNGLDTVYMGIKGDDVPVAMVSAGAPEGVFVLEVEQDSPAMRAAIQAGDIIVGTPITRINKFKDFLILLRGFKPGDSETIVVFRNSQGEYKQINLEISFEE
ncbi:MAG: serine protease [Lachnospiraceae bacterium]|nr:serine protease [Lachnospiraceae bacterium]